MRTQLMPGSVVGLPWFECDPHNGSVEKTVLQSFPFTIGRNDGADLHIDSNQVSREHAVITRLGRRYQVSDLGSTNGTFLNGVKIKEATLSDGDILMIAEVEFTFFSGESEAPSQTVTHVMQGSPSRALARDTVWDTIQSVRRTHEVVTHRGLRTLFQPIVEVAGEKVVGYEAFATSGALGAASARCDHLSVATDCHATDRLRRLFRRLAAEEALSLPHRGRLFVAATAAECAGPSFVQHLCQLRDLLGESQQLVVEIPDSAVHGTDDFRALLTSLHDARIQAAFDEYASGKAQIAEQKDIAPRFLKLASSILRSVHQAVDRKRQVQLTVRASHDIDCTVIATGVDSDADLKVCRELGCTLAQGDLFGRPQSVFDLLRGPRPAVPKPKPAK